MCVLSLIYSYVDVCMFCTVHCVTVIVFSICYCLITRLMFFLIFFLCLISRFVCLLSILCIQCFCTVVCTVSPFVYTAVSLLFMYKPTARCHRVEIQMQYLIFVVPSIMLYSSEISPTRRNNCVFFSAMALLYMFRATISPIIRSTYAVYGHR